MSASVGCQLYLIEMLVSVSTAAGFQLILSWEIMVVEKRCSLVDLYNGICDGSIEVPSSSSHPFEFPETKSEYPSSNTGVTKVSYSFLYTSAGNSHTCLLQWEMLLYQGLKANILLLEWGATGPERENAKAGRKGWNREDRVRQTSRSRSRARSSVDKSFESDLIPIYEELLAEFHPHGYTVKIDWLF